MSMHDSIHHYRETHPDAVLNLIAYSAAIGFLIYFCIWTIGELRIWQ